MNSLIAKKWVAGIFLAVWVLGAGASDWERLEGRVVGISDGDTITLLVERLPLKVRLGGIDSPEKPQPFGERAKQLLSSLVYNKTVTVEYRKKDRYGRIVGKVLLNGKDVNLEMLRGGLAWWYEQYQNEQPFADRGLYAESEQAAKKKNIGLWVDRNPVPPWDFRHARKSNESHSFGHP